MAEHKYKDGSVISGMQVSAYLSPEHGLGKQPPFIPAETVS